MLQINFCKRKYRITCFLRPVVRGLIGMFLLVSLVSTIDFNKDFTRWREEKELFDAEWFFAGTYLSRRRLRVQKFIVNNE